MSMLLGPQNRFRTSKCYISLFQVSFGIYQNSVGLLEGDATTNMVGKWLMVITGFQLTMGMFIIFLKSVKMLLSSGPCSVNFVLISNTEALDIME